MRNPIGEGSQILYPYFTPFWTPSSVIIRELKVIVSDIDTLCRCTRRHPAINARAEHDLARFEQDLPIKPNYCQEERISHREFE